MMASSSSPSSSSSLARSWLHHVFLSFRGPDVRKSFLSHLLKELRSKGIIVFIDNEIRRGKSIAPELIEAIRQSRVAIVLLSPNYASSSWCLDELVEIMKCREEAGQTVFTIFYEVNPTDVRYQTGDFGKAFDETCVGKTEEIRQVWRQALYGVAGIIGYHTSNCVSEADLIDKVASDVMDELGFTPSKDFDDFVGIGARVTEIKSMLVLLSEEVKVFGICGPAGIGKTTISRVLYNQLSPDFQFSTFLEDIRGSFKKPRGNDYQLKLSLQQNLLCQIFNKGDIEVRHLGRGEEMLRDKKVLVVLDGVDNWWQLEQMAKQPGWVGPGSIIIITTEDGELLKTLGLGIDHIYEVTYPTNYESLQIFCLYAFGQKYPDHGFENLAWEVGRLAGNLPLGLRVMGSYLRGKSMDEWIEALPWLRSTLDREIESTLRCSYYALTDNERTLFLHLACLFAGFRIDSFKRYFANSSLVVNYGLKVLAQKSLIYIEHGCLKMHRLLQKMGREIVKKQYMENPAKPYFLTDSMEIADVLHEDTVTGNVLGIRLDTTEKIRISKSAFQGMNSLRFLYVDSNTIRTPEGLDCFPDKLKLLHWKFCPLRFWPSIFSGKFIVELIMQFSNFEMLWEGIKPLPCLKKLDLSYSINLKKIPDLSEATSLEELYLHRCESLLEITSSIGNATKLYRLDMSGCKNIKDFPNVPDSIVVLDCCRTGIKEVPPWIEKLFCLRKLIMYGCENLQTISANISKLENLELLDLRHCDQGLFDYYDEVEDEPYEDDEEVYRFGNVFEAIIEWGPDNKRSWKLRSDFKVHYILPICFPEKAFTSPVSLSLPSNGIKTLPDCIRRLSGLIKLVIKGCIDLVALPPLPDSLVSIDAQGCKSLKTIDSSCFQNPEICLNFVDCPNLEQEARKLIQTSACKYVVLRGEEVPAHFTHLASSNSLTINLTPRPLPSSFRFKACILLSERFNHLGDDDDDDDEEGENSLTGPSYSVRGKHNGLRVGGGSNQLHIPFLYGHGKHLYIFEDSVTLNQDSLEAEETTFNELTFVFRFHYNFWKVKGCSVQLLEANNESAGGEDEDEDDYDYDYDDDDDYYDDDYYDDAGGEGGDDGEDGEDDDDDLMDTQKQTMKLKANNLDVMRMKRRGLG